MKCYILMWYTYDGNIKFERYDDVVKAFQRKKKLSSVFHAKVYIELD